MSIVVSQRIEIIKYILPVEFSTSTRVGGGGGGGGGQTRTTTRLEANLGGVCA